MPICVDAINFPPALVWSASQTNSLSTAPGRERHYPKADLGPRSDDELYRQALERLSSLIKPDSINVDATLKFWNTQRPGVQFRIAQSPEYFIRLIDNSANEANPERRSELATLREVLTGRDPNQPKRLEAFRIALNKAFQKTPLAETEIIALIEAQSSTDLAALTRENVAQWIRAARGAHANGEFTTSSLWRITARLEVGFDANFHLYRLRAQLDNENLQDGSKEAILTIGNLRPSQRAVLAHCYFESGGVTLLNGLAAKFGQEAVRDSATLIYGGHKYDLAKHLYGAYSAGKTGEWDAACSSIFQGAVVSEQAIRQGDFSASESVVRIAEIYEALRQIHHGPGRTLPGVKFVSDMHWLSKATEVASAKSPAGESISTQIGDWADIVEKALPTQHVSSRPFAGPSSQPENFLPMLWQK